MGLFDRLRNDGDEEVELQPPGHTSDYGGGRSRRVRRRESRSNNEEVELSDAGDEDFILPGFKPSGKSPGSRRQQASDSSRDQHSNRGMSRSAGDDRIEELIRQNDRIIELLEELTGVDESQPMEDMW